MVVHVKGSNFTADAIWHRHNGHWKCTDAPPELDWFKRVRHPEVIQNWLKAKNYEYSWSKNFPAMSAESKPPTPAGVV